MKVTRVENLYFVVFHSVSPFLGISNFGFSSLLRNCARSLREEHVRCAKSGELNYRLKPTLKPPLCTHFLRKSGGGTAHSILKSCVSNSTALREANVLLTEGLFLIVNRIGDNPSVTDKTFKYYGFCRDSSLYTREPLN